MKVTVVGTGYVGLVTGACLAEMGNHVVCVDVDERKIRVLKEGGIPIHEPGLREIVHRNVAASRLQFTTDIAESVAHGTIQFIGVGTPPDEDGSADLQYVVAAATNIGCHMTDYKVIVDKSTVPVGTADRVRAAVRAALVARGLSMEFSVVSNPEFLKEGAAVEANAMLATRISFMNELALLAEKVGADIEQVRKGIGSDPRIGTHFLYPGTGYGGSCFPKDVKALIHTGRENGIALGVLQAVDAANERQKHVLVEKIVARLGDDLSGRTFAIWGLAFKPDTDDMRDAPSRVIIEALSRRGARIRAYDPVAMEEAARVMQGMPGLSFTAHQAQALDGADALVVVTEWKEFRNPDFDAIRAALKQPLIFDGRNIYDPALMRNMGVEYHGIGRGIRQQV